jgi:hypothetical protein
MAYRDLHNNVDIVAVVPSIAVGTTGTGQTGSVIDTRGYDAVELAINYGAITATAATFTVTVLEGDVTGTMTSVADTADLLGTESAAGLAAATRVDGSTEKVAKRIGYIGSKRYIRADVKSTATAGTAGWRCCRACQGRTRASGDLTKHPARVALRYKLGGASAPPFLYRATIVPETARRP